MRMSETTLDSQRYFGVDSPRLPDTNVWEVQEVVAKEIRDPRLTTRRFFLIVALAFPLAVLFGFARTYYLKGMFDAPPVPSVMVHAHGIVMALWVLLFLAQVYLISSRRIRIHQRLGWASVALAVLILVTGYFTAIGAARNGSTSFPQDVPRLAFLVVPIFDLVMFVGLFAAAIYYRKKAASHKRLILLTIINFLPPAIARWPIPMWQTFGPLVFFGIPALITIVFLIVDTWKHKQLNKPFAVGGVLLIASYPLRIIASGTDWWMNFAAWLTA